MDEAIDPFKQPRRDTGVLRCPFRGEEVLMLLRHAEVRRAAADPTTFSSDAPFRVPIPSEEDVRTVRQLPIETDPPEHGRFRAITDPFFRRPKDPTMIAAVGEMIDQFVMQLASDADAFDAMTELALPVQSIALTHLLNVPTDEAKIWIGWGIHVFKVTGGEFKTGNVLEDYLNRKFDEAEADPGSDFFSALVQAKIDDRPLSREQCLGFANLAFAGGRDTVIHTLLSITAYLGENPDQLEYLRADPKRIVLASEEFFRVYMPLTQIGRVCPAPTEIGGEIVEADRRVGLCWSSANFDETVFEDPHTIKLDRRPNPHVSFGFRDHLCQGAAHARLVVRSYLTSLCNFVRSIEVVQSATAVEREAMYERQVGYEDLRVRFQPK